MPSAKLDFQRKCIVCGEAFTPKTITSRCCSAKCTKIASKRKKEEERKAEELSELISQIPEARDYITVPEAVAMFGISRDTIYRLIRKGTIPCVNLGERLTRISKDELSKMYPVRNMVAKEDKPIAKLYSLEPEDCYNIGEIAKKFHINEGTVYSHIRKYSIPTRQIGNYVYAPKAEIDKLYK